MGGLSVWFFKSLFLGGNCIGEWGEKVLCYLEDLLKYGYWFGEC